MNIWIAIGVTAVGCYAVKLAGLLVPAGVLERPLVRRLAALLPVALLAALTAQQTFSDGQSLMVDARAAGVAGAAAVQLPGREQRFAEEPYQDAVAAVALMLRAPFLLVVASAVVVTAGVRALGG
ncbi:AzlD domain-containing protein [Streptomyces calvus]|uniref:AzlD domain-containing protein n=1 Tax=Streptomyces calvus TaxID=67282 RepID=UPI003627B359